MITVSTSVPVVTVTVRAPMAAAVSMVSEAVADVREFTVTGPAAPRAPPPTEMPAPKLATVVPLAKLVNWPVKVTDTVELGRPTLGEITVNMDVPGWTVNPAGSETVSEPVVTVTVRAPAAVLPAMVMGTESTVGPFTVMVPAVMPLPKLTVLCA